MDGTQTIVTKRKKNLEPEQLSHQDAYKLCNEKRFEIKLHRIEVPVLFNEKCSANEVAVTSKKRKRESAKKTIESMVDRNKITEANK